MTRYDERPDTLSAMSNHLSEPSATTTPAAPSSRPPFDPNAEAVVLRSMEIMGGSPLEAFHADFHEVYHPECVNHEAEAEPPATRGRGPEAMYATAQWLQAAYADLNWEIHEVLVERDLVAVHCTMSGRHHGDFVTYTKDGAVGDVFPPTGKRFATTQSHWFRVRDGKVVEHWANRDDLGTAQQLGWVPPTPPYLLRMALGKRRARRRERAAA
jgi:predicted ester cyclase